MKSTQKVSKKGVLMPPAVGYSINVLWFLLRHFKIDLRYGPRFFLTLLINLINWPFRTYERLFINPRYKQLKEGTEIIFIIGHWRSGTTHLHNLMAQDPQMGYTTTYQSVFPDTLFNRLGYFLFEGFARLLVPGKRAGDNVRLGMQLPQEEEFALGAKTPLCFYYFWMFPKDIRRIYERSIRFKNASSELINQWTQDYELLISKSLKNTGKRVYLSKNPSHTGRIKYLLKSFPKAKFIFIHRNPLEVFLSTDNFFKNMMPHLQLQAISKRERQQSIIDLYMSIMVDFFSQKDLIPEEQYAEVSFENLEKNPLSSIESIYKDLNIEGYSTAKPKFQSYIDQMRSYKKNKHVISKSQMELLLEHLQPTMEALGYEIPEHIQVV
ncbi:MAG TPA: sulfotransferase [Cytophagales bacterium]|jgi:hypothetical protein|nr:sulfotransferase [Cytophagales bacterium]